MVSAKQKIVQVAFSKARKEGLSGKALGRRIKQLLGTRVKSKSTKRRKSKPNKPRTSKRKSTTKKSMAGKKGGTKGMTRIKKFLIGLGIGVGVSTATQIVRVPGLEGSAPILDAAVGGGVEGQVGVAIPRLIRTLLNLRGGGNGPSTFEGSA